MSRSHQGHARRSLDVFKCLWNDFEIFHEIVKIMILRTSNHDSHANDPEESASHHSPPGLHEFTWELDYGTRETVWKSWFSWNSEKILKSVRMHLETSSDPLGSLWWLLDMPWVFKTWFWESSFLIMFDQFWVKWRPGRHRYAADGDMRLEKSESPSKIIWLQPLRLEFGLDLTYGNMG